MCGRATRKQSPTLDNNGITVLRPAEQAIGELRERRCSQEKLAFARNWTRGPMAEDAVAREPFSCPKFPANREKYWEFRFGLGLFSEITTTWPVL